MQGGIPILLKHSHTCCINQWQGEISRNTQKALPNRYLACCTLRCRHTPWRPAFRPPKRSKTHAVHCSLTWCEKNSDQNRTPPSTPKAALLPPCKNPPNGHTTDTTRILRPACIHRRHGRLPILSAFHQVCMKATPSKGT